MPLCSYLPPSSHGLPVPPLLAPRATPFPSPPLLPSRRIEFYRQVKYPIYLAGSHVQFIRYAQGILSYILPRSELQLIIRHWSQIGRSHGLSTTQSRLLPRLLPSWPPATIWGWSSHSIHHLYNKSHHVVPPKATSSNHITCTHTRMPVEHHSDSPPPLR